MLVPYYTILHYLVVIDLKHNNQKKDASNLFSLIFLWLFEIILWFQKNFRFFSYSMKNDNGVFWWLYWIYIHDLNNMGILNRISLNPWPRDIFSIYVCLLQFLRQYFTSFQCNENQALAIHAFLYPVHNVILKLAALLLQNGWFSPSLHIFILAPNAKN